MRSDLPTTPISAEAPETHEMELVASYASGAQHWRCPQCSRQTMLQPPGPRSRFRLLVLEAGNEHVAHVTGGAGLRLSASSPVGPDGPPPDGLLH